MDRYEKGLKRFIELLLTTKDKESQLALCDLFLTAEEKTDLGMRFLIIDELIKNNLTQREIAKTLNVSIAKITRGSNELKRMDKKLLTYLTKKLSNL